MGLYHALLTAEIGQCEPCGKRYVVFAEINDDDSHHVSDLYYSCPNCGANSPVSMRLASDIGDSDFQLAKRQLEDVLAVGNNNKLRNID